MKKTGKTIALTFQRMHGNSEIIKRRNLWRAIIMYIAKEPGILNNVKGKGNHLVIFPMLICR